ncbi:hypothetical protein CDL12_16732 [Handroanthus impetiginosus]|uniref:RIN4 pathogenic type III effector avirulence factor Avr cleavage site domain-containing protein n=1 Tax=Handroanthus impetiginosus TaxID=429701 RepID=A0A2G9GIH4_9LAMI|nr:hypothetical protein CDL12_22363 [Handroanthus impetiginosus]PIN10676.1 hypothetical protein CDL12_16732 [Handroanthus impetiginosus]
MSEKENVALPKFGSWDVNNPAAAGQYSVIFDRARNEKRTGDVSQDRRDSPRGSEIMPLTKLTKPSASRRWLCCSNLKYAED